MQKHILVPLDGSLLAVGTVNRAIDHASQCDARITFFHVVADYPGSQEGALMHALDPAIFAEQAAGHALGILAKAELAARARGVLCDSQFAVSDRPYEAILNAAATEQCDLIFMASHGRPRLARLMVGSQTLKVLAGATVPVLVDVSEANAPRQAMARALAIIQDEHRTLGVVLTGSQRLLRELRDAGAQPDFRLLRALVHYLREFALQLHHPKEDTYLFDRLRRRTRVADATLVELERQHQEDPLLLSRMEQALDTYSENPVTGLSEFSAALDTYSAFVSNHLTVEEMDILPAARTHLTDEDWNAISEAFGRNGDPRFHPEVGESFRDLLSRILFRMPAEDETDVPESH